jgi:ubiquinone/menaquinone biosynthesis C-methylase UbiE
VTRPAGWLSYDTVAETYRRVAVPWFTALANDLVTAVAPNPGDSVLDVGTGTGLAARAALDIVGMTGAVVGADPSRGMLAQAFSHPRMAIVSAMAPGLPFTDGVFDAVTANLVVSHLPDYDAGLADMVRVLRARGRLGCSAWAPEPGGPDNDRAEANQIVESIRAQLGLDAKPTASAAPWEDHFHEEGRLEDALTRAGLTDVRVDEHTYRWTFTVGEFLSGWGSVSRYLRHRAREQRWHTYVTETTCALREVFDDRIRVVDNAWVATGTRSNDDLKS